MEEKKKIFRCAIYSRKSHEDGLEQSYNSLDAQRESAENYIASQKMNGWQLLPEKYDDGGFSGGNMERPALKRLMADVETGKIDIVVIYKFDRLSRSLLDFVKLVEFFETHNASLVSITQQVNTSTSAGRMMLNILITFSEFEREILIERIRDKIAGAKRRGKHCGGYPVLGYDTNPETKTLVVNEKEAKLVRHIFDRYCQVGSAREVARELNKEGHKTKTWTTRKGKHNEGGKFKPDLIYRILKNPLYIGKVVHRDKTYPGEQKAIIQEVLWDKAQGLLSGNLVANTGRKNEIATPLKGLLKCGHCNGSLGLTYTQKKDRRYIYYICEKDAKRAMPECPIKRVPAGEIEYMALKYLSEIFRTPSLLAKTYFKAMEIEEVEKSKLLERREKLTAELEILRAKLIQAIQGAPGKKREKVQSVKDEIEQLSRALSEVESSLGAFDSPPISSQDMLEAFSSIEALWEELFPVERYRLLHLLIEKITVSTDGVRLELKTAGMGSLVGEFINPENVEAI
jgi:site-specific DNA recombinase